MATILADVDLSPDSAIRDSLRADLLERLRSIDRRNADGALSGIAAHAGGGLALVGRLGLVACALFVGVFLLTPALSWVATLAGGPVAPTVTQTVTMTPTEPASMTPTLIATWSIPEVPDPPGAAGRADLRVVPYVPLPTPEPSNAHNVTEGPTFVPSPDTGADAKRTTASTPPRGSKTEQPGM